MATEARQQAQAEKLTLLVAANKSGYFGVTLNQPGKPKPYQAQVRRGGKMVHLGIFATAKEAALCIARTPEGRAAAAKRAAAVAPLTSEEVQQQAQAEKLTLLVADNKAGYFGVLLGPGLAKPYRAQVVRGGKVVSLSSFVTAKEAALCIARTPEGRAAVAKRAAAPAPMTRASSEAWSRQRRREETGVLTERSADRVWVGGSTPSLPGQGPRTPLRIHLVTAQAPRDHGLRAERRTRQRLSTAPAHNREIHVV